MVPVSRYRVMSRRLRPRARLALLGLPPGRRQRLGRARRRAESWAAGRPLDVLDAGCEYGLFAVDVGRRHRTWSVTGVDVVEEPLEQARELSRSLGLTNTQFRRVDLTQPWAGARYDVVAALECLVEIDDHEAALAALRRATRPGGLVLLQVPTDTWRPVLSSADRAWRRQARHGYSAQEVRRLLQDAGFDDVRVTATMRWTARLAQDVRDRWKHRGRAVQLALLPVMACAVALDDRGVTLGSPRAWFVEGHAPSEPAPSSPQSTEATP